MLSIENLDRFPLQKAPLLRASEKHIEHEREESADWTSQSASGLAKERLSEFSKRAEKAVHSYVQSVRSVGGG